MGRPINRPQKWVEFVISVSAPPGEVEAALSDLRRRYREKIRYGHHRAAKRMARREALGWIIRYWPEALCRVVLLMRLAGGS